MITAQKVRLVRDWFTTLLLVSLVTVVSYDYWRKNLRPPAVFSEVLTLNSPVPRGDWLKVRIVREKLRSCPVESKRSARDSNGRVYDLPDANWVGGPVDQPWLEFEYDVSGLPPGEYLLDVFLTYDCPEREYKIQQPFVTFSVRETTP